MNYVYNVVHYIDSTSLCFIESESRSVMLDSLQPHGLKGSPRILEWVAYPFSSGSFQPRNRTGVSCIASRFFTNWAIREVFTYLLPYLSTYLSKNWKFVPSDYLHPIPTSPMPHLCNHKADLFFCVWICLLVFDV